MATLCRLDVFLLFTFLNIISNSRPYVLLFTALAAAKARYGVSPYVS